MTTNQEQIPALQQLLRSTHQDVMEAIDGIAELEIRQVPVPDEWTVAQLMAHIAEIQYFWMEKAVLITQEDDPNIITRRDVENDRRAAAVEDHARDSLDELIRDWPQRTNRPSVPPVESRREIWVSLATGARTIQSPWKG